MLSLAPRGGPQLGHTVVRLQHIHEAGTELAPLPGDGPAITRSAVGDISVPGGFRGLLANATAVVVDERSLSVVRAWADVLASRKQRQVGAREVACSASSGVLVCHSFDLEGPRNVRCRTQRMQSVE